MITNRRILITGVAGSIGSELCRQLSKHNKIFGIDNNESGFFDIQQETGCFGRVGDIRDEKTCFDIFSDFKPQLVINCAALKHVPMSQLYPREYVTTNIIGNLNLIEEAKKWECLEKYLFISTDKVVSGNKNVMGASKMCSESITTSMGDKFIAVRFGNILRSRGSVVGIWDKQVAKNEPITITDINMERFMMTIPNACELVIEALEKGTGGQVWCLDMGKQKKIIDLKNELYGVDYPIKIIGVRDGESISENLMTLEESNIAEKIGNFFVIKKI
jgi:FlaA1/EpsC-like NDP-sugar epimerase